MSNAFTSFNPSRRFLRDQAKKIQSLVPGKSETMDTLSGKMQLQILPSGKKRVQMELVERNHREALLRALSLLKDKENTEKVDVENDRLSAVPLPAEEPVKVIQTESETTIKDSQNQERGITPDTESETQMRNSTSGDLAANYENDFEEPVEQKPEATPLNVEEQINIDEKVKLNGSGDVAANYENDFEEPAELNTYTDDFETSPEQVIVPSIESTTIEPIPAEKVDDSASVGLLAASILDDLVVDTSDVFKIIAMEAVEHQADFRRYLVDYFTAALLAEVVTDFAQGIAEKINACYRRCEFSILDLDARKASLIMLSDLTRAIEEEQKLKLLFTSGKPPAPPKLWMGPIKPSDNKKGKKESILSPEDEVQLQLYWEPGDAKDHVSFYSLEFGGNIEEKSSFYCVY